VSAEARRRVAEHFRGLSSSTTRTDTRLARAVMDGRVRWLEDGIVDQSEGTGPWIASDPPGE
jgi:hypothetical protein